MAITQATLSVINNPLCRRPVVERAIGESRATIYRNINRGLFPRPVKIGGDRVAWPANEIQAIINARIAGRTDDQIRALVVEIEAARSMLTP